MTTPFFSTALPVTSLRAPCFTAGPSSPRVAAVADYFNTAEDAAAWAEAHEGHVHETTDGRIWRVLRQAPGAP